MKPIFIFCHGWGFDKKFFRTLIDEYFSKYCCYCLDLGYFGKKNLEFPNNSGLIGIGHSLGLIKLASLNRKFRALIGIQSFINFLGFNRALQKKRQLELQKMISNFGTNPLDTLISFHKRCHVTYPISRDLNIIQLMRDLELLNQRHTLPDIPLLIIGSKNDIIVPTELVFDNFSNYVNVVFHDKGYHGLGLYETDFVHHQVINFVNGIR